MQWIVSKPKGMFFGLFAVQSDGRLSSELAHPDEVDYAANELKRQIDAAAKQIKKELARPKSEKLAALRAKRP